MDCVVGKKKTSTTLLVLTERKTSKEIIIKMKARRQQYVIEALNRIENWINNYPRKIFNGMSANMMEKELLKNATFNIAH